MSWFSILKEDYEAGFEDYSYHKDDKAIAWNKAIERHNALRAKRKREYKKKRIRELEDKMRELKNRQILPSTSIYEIEERKKEYKKLKRKLFLIKNNK